MAKFSKLTETFRREAAKPENQRRARQLLGKLRARKQRPRNR